MATLIGCGAVRWASAVAAQPEGEITTAETAIVVAAGEHAPRLLRLKLRGAAAWKNTREDALPERVEIQGAPLPVLWRLDRAASRFESKNIQIVYVADSPRLRTRWGQRGRADFGPIEHSPAVQN